MSSLKSHKQGFCERTIIDYKAGHILQNYVLISIVLKFSNSKTRLYQAFQTCNHTMNPDSKIMYEDIKMEL